MIKWWLMLCMPMVCVRNVSGFAQPAAGALWTTHVPVGRHAAKSCGCSSSPNVCPSSRALAAREALALALYAKCFCWLGCEQRLNMQRHRWAGAQLRGRKHSRQAGQLLEEGPSSMPPYLICCTLRRECKGAGVNSMPGRPTAQVVASATSSLITRFTTHPGAGQPLHHHTAMWQRMEGNSQPAPPSFGYHPSVQALLLPGP